MHNQKPEFNAKMAMALIVFVVAGSFAWPLLSSQPTKQVTNEPLFFENIESALSAFSIVCLRSGASFSSIKKDLADSGATVTKIQHENQTHTAYFLSQLGGSVIFTKGENSEACGVTAHSEYLEAEAAAIDWFLNQEKAPNFPMFGDQSHLRTAVVTYDAHVWQLEKPDQNRLDLVQIKENSEGLSSISRTFIDFNQ